MTDQRDTTQWLQATARLIAREFEARTGNVCDVAVVLTTKTVIFGGGTADGPVMKDILVEAAASIDVEAASTLQ